MLHYDSEHIQVRVPLLCADGCTGRAATTDDSVELGSDQISSSYKSLLKKTERWAYRWCPNIMFSFNYQLYNDQEKHSAIPWAVTLLLDEENTQINRKVYTG